MTWIIYGDFFSINNEYRWNCVIIVAAIKFSANIITKRLEKKYSLKLEKEFEEYKTLLGKKTYVSKVRFDKEFEIYQELSDTITIELREYLDNLEVKIDLV